jgi:group I intron endonuclease
MTSNKTAGVYQITCIANGKKYIGSSIHIERRLKNHKYLLNLNKHKNTHFQNAWDKYGEEQFLFEILKIVDIASIEAVRDVEQEILDTYSSCWEELFNIATKVDMSVSSEETRAKQSEAMKRALAPEEKRKAISEQSKINWQNPEYRKKHKESLKLAAKRPEVMAKNSARGKQAWTVPEYREKIINSIKERWANDDYKLAFANKRRKSGGGISKTKNNRYSAYIKNKGKSIYLGIFDTHEEALSARLKAEEYYWTGELKPNEIKERPVSKKRVHGGGISVTKGGRYSVSIYLKDRNKHLGTFDTREEALKARLDAEELYWGGTNAV